MDKRIVATDASPLITLISAGAFDLLRKLFGRITVTTAVRDEVRAGGQQPGARELNAAVEEGWADIVDVSLTEAPFRGLGNGEASVLELARKHRGPSLLLIDDLLARSHARTLGKPVTGVVGILLVAKRRRLIPEVGPLLARLTGSGFRLSDQLLRDALAEAGETP